MYDLYFISVFISVIYMHKILSSLLDEGKVEVSVVMDEGTLFTGRLGFLLTYFRVSATSQVWICKNQPSRSLCSWGKEKT